MRRRFSPAAADGVTCVAQAASRAFERLRRLNGVRSRPADARKNPAPPGCRYTFGSRDLPRFRNRKFTDESMRFEYERNPRLAYQDKRVAQAYHDLYAASTGWRSLPARFVAHREWRAIEGFARRLPHRKILDLPAGTGKLAGLFAALDSDVVASDISESMLKLAAAEYARIGYRRVSFAVNDAIDLEAFGTSHFDLVVCLRLLHRVPAALRKTMLAQFASVAPYAIVSYGIDNAFHRARHRARACHVRRPRATAVRLLRGRGEGRNRIGVRDRGERLDRARAVAGNDLRPEVAGSVPGERRKGNYVSAPWQCLYFLPLPQGHGSLRPTLGPLRTIGVAVATAVAPASPNVPSDAGNRFG